MRGLDREMEYCYRSHGRRIAFGYLGALMDDAQVTDIAVTVDGKVWADRGAGMREEQIYPGFTGPEMVRAYAVQICSQLGKRLDDSCPIADASTEDGIRIHAVIAPIVTRGACLSIRLPQKKIPLLPEMAAGGFMSTAVLPLLRSLVEKRATILISGGTGSGKTTLLKALLSQCSASERIVSVEEVRELGHLPGHDNYVSLTPREANVEGAGCIDLSELVKATLRMRPDRIVLGECRGEEIADLLRAFNSGHRGGMTTVHSNGVERIPARMVTLGLLAGLEPKVLASLVVGAFDVVLHLEKMQGHRCLSQIGLLAMDASGQLKGLPLCWYDKRGEVQYGSLWKDFVRKWGYSYSGSRTDKISKSQQPRTKYAAPLLGEQSNLQGKDMDVTQQ